MKKNYINKYIIYMYVYMSEYMSKYCINMYMIKYLKIFR